MSTGAGFVMTSATSLLSSSVSVSTAKQIEKETTTISQFGFKRTKRIASALQNSQMRDLNCSPLMAFPDIHLTAVVSWLFWKASLVNFLNSSLRSQTGSMSAAFVHLGSASLLSNKELNIFPSFPAFQQTILSTHFWIALNVQFMRKQEI